MLSFSMTMILVSFAVFAFVLYFRFHHLHQAHSPSQAIQHSPQQLSSDHLLEFDRELNKILNNPHLSDADKERLSNEYAEQYLLKNAMD